MSINSHGYVLILSALIIPTCVLFLRIPAAASSPGVRQEEVIIQHEAPLTPQEYLASVAGKDAEVLSRLIQCESGWKIDIKNKNSSATGLAQFIAGTWKWARERMNRDIDLELRKDPYESIDTLIYLWDGGQGSSHWSESANCWK